MEVTWLDHSDHGAISMIRELIKDTRAGYKKEAMGRLDR
jgi:hypothetical protein